VTYSAIILSGGESTRFGQDKGLFKVFHQPLISFVIEKVKPFIDELLIVTNQRSVNAYSSLFPSIRILIDQYNFRGALAGIATGLNHARGMYSYILPSDTPLLSAKILALLRNSSSDHDAVIPRWPSGYLEPLQAIYHTQATTRAALLSIQEENYRLRNMISHLEDVKYISTTTLTQYDPNLRTFFNINQVDDLQKIRHLLAGKKPAEKR
jgi:molybdopterin-guanine dinucleotide biosynthesis protein A